MLTDPILPWEKAILEVLEFRVEKYNRNQWLETEARQNPIRNKGEKINRDNGIIFKQTVVQMTIRSLLLSSDQYHMLLWNTGFRQAEVLRINTRVKNAI